MASDKLARRLRQPLRDFLLGLGLFVVIAASGAAERGYTHGIFAHSAHAGWEQQATEAIGLSLEELDRLGASGVGIEKAVSVGILAVAVSGLFALNLWFARHLRQVAVSYRRRAWSSDGSITRK